MEGYPITTPNTTLDGPFELTDDRRLHGSLLLSVIVVAGLAVLVGLAPAALSLRLSYAIAALVALALFASPWPSETVMALALVVATVVGESGLVAAAGRNLPFLVLAPAIFLRLAARYRGRWRELARPPLAVIITAGLYLVTSGFSIIVGMLGGRRPYYASLLEAIMALSLVIGLVAVPTILRSPATRRALIVVFAVLGPALVALSGAIWLIGAVHWAGAWIGTWVFTELTIVTHPVGLVFARVTGPFARPAGASTVYAVSLAATLVLLPSLQGRWRWAAIASWVVVNVAMLLTLNRDGWLIAGTEAGLLAVFGLWQRRFDRWSIATAVFYVAVLGALSLRLWGANLRPDAAIEHYGPEIAATIPGTDFDIPTEIRGGTSLNGRDALWLAASKAIAQRPIAGWGLGSEQQVIGPLLAPDAQRFRGETSDSLWLHDAVETGLIGLATLVAFCLAVVAGIARRAIRWPGQLAADPLALLMAAMFVAMLVGATFETYQLGGATFPNIELGLAAGLALAVSKPTEPNAATA